VFSSTSVFNSEFDSHFSILESAGSRNRSAGKRFLIITIILRKIYFLAVFCLIRFRRFASFLRRRREYSKVRDSRPIILNIKKKYNFFFETTAASVYYLILHQIYCQVSGRSGYSYNKIIYSLLLLRCAVLLLSVF